MKVKKKHATVSATDGVNYRDMASVMTELGFPMYHSSARNNVLRVMHKFASEICVNYGIVKTEEEIWEIARSPDFQSVIGQILNRNADERAIDSDE